MTEYRKGSAGAAEQKSNRISLAVFGAIVLGLLALLFIGPNDLHTEVLDAPLWMNIVGGVLVGGSMVPLILAAKAEDTKGYIKVWLAMIVVGFFIAVGFFDNAHSYLNNIK